ncbi:hybrid sensor histidine kinase/response regulator transcription factor [Confluentibacter citreus]|uniref:hybrid sensor histidine kinase/response regulator transcription factor n=1 Tax=Confluentibacter citreus TaxID=2007307 RepID=UPI000C28E2C8|nr:hybrid sensor histidine kinase/response regulator transcription factor [Confluentibacter citreus]
MISKFNIRFLVFKLGMLAFMFSWPPVQSQSQLTSFMPVAPEELSNSFVRCFLKDSKGYMWFGTNDGLIRYDGINTYRYVHNPIDNKTITNNSINAIIEDSNHKLWIGTGQGLSNYNRETDNFTNVDSIPGNKNHLNNVYITALSFDDQGKLWIGTHGGGVNIYDISSLTFSYLSGINTHSSPLAKDYISKLLLIDNNMWCGTKGGLKVFNTTTTKPASLKFTGEGLPMDEISELIIDDFDTILFSTSNGEITKVIYKDGYYSFKNIVSKYSKNGLGVSGILALAADSKGNLWIGGENSKLIYFDIKNNKLTYFGNESGNPKKLPTNSIRSVYIDDDGLTWIGTFNKGVYLIDNNAGKFDSYQLGDFKASELEGKDIREFVEDKKGDIWIACDGIGLIRLDSETNELKRCDEINRQLDTKFITAMTFDRQGNIWVASWADGVYKINLSTNRAVKYMLQSGGFGDNKAFFLYLDKKGTIWAGSNGSGLFYFDEKRQRFVILYEENKPNYISKTSYVSSMVEDYEGGLWIGTMYGLYKLTRNEDGLFNYQLYRQDIAHGGFSSNNIQDIYQDAHENLWFGTTDNGIVLKPRQSNEFKTFQKKDGLSSNTIRSILMDSVGNIWISGNKGLSKLDLSTNTFTNYDKLDGLASNNFNNSASITTSKGKLFFGSNNGFNTFYPDSIQSHSGTPIVYLTDLKINNQSMAISGSGSPLNKHISLTSNIELSYDQRSFTIDFVAINYGKKAPYEYCYMLEGFDKSWNCIGSGHSATYTNIDPGDYVFLVNASNSDGTWANTSERLHITIKQIWWKTWWAILIYVIFIASVVYFLSRIRMERIRMKNQLVMERLAREQEHQLSESKTQFFTNISHEFRTPLSLIAMPLESLSAMEELPFSVKERIGAIQASSNKMLRLVNELMDFNKLENTKLKLQVQQGELVRFITDIADSFNDISKKRNIHFGIHSMVGALHGWFDHDKLDKILVNILSNAFKFTSDKGQINIIINSKEAIVGDQQVKSRCLELSILDNGIGIPENELPFIFDKFYQATSSPSIANSGTGIGLSLTKGLVELHHGHIKVESKPNHETLFVIVIPIDKEIYSDDNVCEISECIDTVPESMNHIETINYDLDDEESNDKPQILIVEDNDELRKYLALELRHQFHVMEAKNGQEGLEVALETSPDLIISDILMPIKNGIDLCKDIKTNLKTSHIPFILLTARTTVDDQITGIETGADVYITKPFSIRFLIVQVNQIIESRQKLYSQFSKDVYLLPNKVAQNEIDQEFLQRAIDYIIENIQNPQLGVNSIAELFNLSRMQVYRKIKALTGKSVVNFIRMVRIKQALKLMDTQKYALAEIAYLTGFNSASYFTTSFKEEYGKAPSEYLEQNI